MINIKNELEKNSIILSVMPIYYYNESIAGILKSLENAKICYVDLNKGADAMQKSFRLNNINTKNIFFIDGVTSTISPKAKIENGILLSSPYALTEMAIAISEAMKTNAFDILVFDSLSTLNVYSKEISHVSGKFTSAIVNKLRSGKNKGVLTCLEDDISSDLIKQSSLFVDKIIKIKTEENELIKADKITNGVIASLMMAFGGYALLTSANSNPTALAVYENTAGINTNFLILAIIIFTLIGSLLIIKSIKKPKMLKIRYGIAERKNKTSVKREFRAKIVKWLKNIKALNLF